MKTLFTTKMSSRGQVVIPEDIRKLMKLEKGAQFVVLSEGDAILLKQLTPPSLDQFNRLLTLAREQVEKSGFRKQDLDEAIERARE